MRNAGVYAIMADESKDISKIEQLSIALRYVRKVNVYERFVTYMLLVWMQLPYQSTSLIH